MKCGVLVPDELCEDLGKSVCDCNLRRGIKAYFRTTTHERMLSGNGTDAGSYAVGWRFPRDTVAVFNKRTDSHRGLSLYIMRTLVSFVDWAAVCDRFTHTTYELFLFCGRTFCNTGSFAVLLFFGDTRCVKEILVRRL